MAFYFVLFLKGEGKLYFSILLLKTTVHLGSIYF